MPCPLPLIATQTHDREVLLPPRPFIHLLLLLKEFRKSAALCSPIFRASTQKIFPKQGVHWNLNPECSQHFTLLALEYWQGASCSTDVGAAFPVSVQLAQGHRSSQQQTSSSGLSALPWLPAFSASQMGNWAGTSYHHPHQRYLHDFSSFLWSARSTVLCEWVSKSKCVATWWLARAQVLSTKL